MSLVAPQRVHLQLEQIHLHTHTHLLLDGIKQSYKLEDSHQGRGNKKKSWIFTPMYFETHTSEEHAKKGTIPDDHQKI